MKLVETRKLEVGKVRVMCIRNNYYTFGTNEDYDKMFCKCENNNILEIASDILEHSDKERLMHQSGCSEREVLENICFQLINDCCYTCVEIKD